MQLDRRSVIKGAGGAGLTLLFSGTASASDGRARYLARTNGNGADAVEDAGFEVLNELAGGETVLVKGPDDAVETLRDVRGVTDAVQDITVDVEKPVVEENGYGGGLPDDPDELYDELLWDKQRQDVREAQEYATGAGRTIAIIDTGIDDEHPDLDVDVGRSTAIVDGQPQDHVGDPNGHGTHVAGTAAATGDALMTGTAPDATLVSVDVLGYSTGTFGDIMAGMEYAADVGADAANISLGYMVAPQEFAEFEENVGMYRRMFEPVANYGRREGTLYVGSGGNDDTNLQGGWLRLWNGLAGVIGVSATDPDDERVFYSNYGTNDIDVGAPGGGYDTVPRTYCGYAEWVQAGSPMTPTDDPREPGTETTVCFDEDGSPVVAFDEEDEEAVECVPCTIPDWPYPFNFVFSTYPTGAGGYSWLGGTSMAAPQVTGLAALVRELDEDANPNQVINAIKQGAEGANGRGEPILGAGRVNALNTVERMR